MTSDMRQDGMERAYIERPREADPQTEPPRDFRRLQLSSKLEP
jgi:hypothetical protein